MPLHASGVSIEDHTNSWAMDNAIIDPIVINNDPRRNRFVYKSFVNLKLQILKNIKSINHK
jgi:hypothetical protein